MIGQILISNQRQAFLPNLKAKYLQTALTNPDAIVIHTDLENIVAKDELKIAQNLLLQLGVPQDHACRHELRKKAQIIDYRLDYKQLLVELPIPLSNSKQLRFILNKKNIFSHIANYYNVINNISFCQKHTTYTPNVASQKIIEDLHYLRLFIHIYFVE